jgi:hypothetical protein
MNIATFLDVIAIMLGIYFVVDKVCTVLDGHGRRQKRELRAARARLIADDEQEQRRARSRR